MSDIYEKRFTGCVTRLVMMCREPSAASAALSLVPDDAFVDPNCQLLVAATRAAIAEHGNATSVANFYPVILKMAAADEQRWVDTESFNLWDKYVQEHCQTWQDELAQAKECAVHIKRHKTRLDIALAATEAAQVARDPFASDEKALRAVSTVGEAAENAAPHRPELLNDIITEVQDGEPAEALRTGYRFWDYHAEGIWQGITVISGQPGCGKTALALQLVLGALRTNQDVSAVWGLGEMTQRDIVHRAASCVSVNAGPDAPVELRHIRSNTQNGKNAVSLLGSEIDNRLAIVEDISIPNLCNALVKYDAKILVVDYMQLVPHDGEENRTAGLDSIAGQLVRLCTMRGVYVIAISSLPKGSNSDSAIGSLARGSGMVDYAANSFYLGKFDDSADKTQPYPVTWLCKKQRQGKLFDIQSVFDGDFQHFGQPDVEIQEPDADLAKAWG